MAGESLDSLAPSSSRESSFYTSGSRFPAELSPPSYLYSSASAPLSRRSPRFGSIRSTQDHVASISEPRSLLPSTPKRDRKVTLSPGGHHGEIWNPTVPSALAPNTGPLVQHLLTFGTKPTLEWACAKDRMARKTKHLLGEAGNAILSTGLGAAREVAGIETDTEEESGESLYPNGSIGAFCEQVFLPSEMLPRPGSRVHGSGRANVSARRIYPQDDETMKAAIALCDLRRLGGP